MVIAPVTFTIRIRSHAFSPKIDEFERRAGFSSSMARMWMRDIRWIKCNYSWSIFDKDKSNEYHGWAILINLILWFILAFILFASEPAISAFIAPTLSLAFSHCHYPHDIFVFVSILKFRSIDVAIKSVHLTCDMPFPSLCWNGNGVKPVMHLPSVNATNDKQLFSISRLTYFISRGSNLLWDRFQASSIRHFKFRFAVASRKIGFFFDRAYSIYREWENENPILWALCVCTRQRSLHIFFFSFSIIKLCYRRLRVQYGFEFF